MSLLLQFCDPQEHAHNVQLRTSPSGSFSAESIAKWPWPTLKSCCSEQPQFAGWGKATSDQQMSPCPMADDSHLPSNMIRR
jgi:hypothetical protein